MITTDTRTALLQAQARLAEVFATLDVVGPALPEPERGAALALRADVAHGVRSLGCIAASIGMEVGA